MAALGRWKIPQTRSGRRSISVHKLLKKEKDGTLFKKHGMDPAVLERWYTRMLERRGEVPSRDEVDVNPNPKVEQRQDSRGTLSTGEVGAGGFDDVAKYAGKGKISHAMETLGQLSRSWEVPSDDEDQTGAQDVDHHGPFGTTISQISAGTDIEATKAAAAVEFAKLAHRAHCQQVFENAFYEELSKIAEANSGIQPWVGELEGFRQFVGAELTKEAFSGGIGGALGGVRQFAQRAVGRLRPQGASAVMPEVKAFRQGTGFFSTGMGKDLAAGGKALAHNPQAAGRAAGLGTKELGALQQMRPTSAGRRITGEVAHGAGHHIANSHPLQLALNPIGTGMGGAIEGAARGVGKELQTSARSGVQTAGRLMQQHAPKIGLGGELVAGGFLHTPGLASAIGGAIAPAAHGVAQHALGEGAQRLGRAIPRAIPRAAQMAGRAFA